jgi:flagellar P-ring protein precursor FlgI
VRGNQLLGYGLIVGLNGTGDSSSASFTFQSIVSMLQKFGITVPKSEITVKNVAAVVVTAELPPFIREGSRIDVTVSSLGNASNLQGGILLMTPLQGPDGNVYAVAQGPVSIGGFNAGTDEGTAGGMSVQKNHPTVGRVPNGALIEREVAMDFVSGNMVRVVLAKPDFTTCDRLVKAINKEFESSPAAAYDAGSVKVSIPFEYANNVIGLIARLEKIEVSPDAVAAIVINERTGTIVAGERVKISTVAVSHGNLSIEIKSRYKISQPLPFSRAGTTSTVSEYEATVEEEKARMLVLTEGVDIGEVANALNALGVTPRDMISIFQAMKEASALQAELRIM